MYSATRKYHKGDRLASPKERHAVSPCMISFANALAYNIRSLQLADFKLAECPNFNA
ncbi:MAG: hypothetical protein ACFCU7_05750 [Pleurocapsa sp.]